MNNFSAYLVLVVLGTLLINQSVFGQEDIDLIHGKWNLKKMTVNGVVELDYSKSTIDTVLMVNNTAYVESINARYIQFFRGNFGQNSGTAVYNLTKSDKQFALLSMLKKPCLDSILYTFSSVDKVIMGYSWSKRELIMRLNLAVLDSNTIELISITTNSRNEEQKTNYILTRDQEVIVGTYLPWSPKCYIILRQNGENDYASSIGSSEEKEILLKKKKISIILNQIPQKTKSIDFGIHIVFSENFEAKKAFQKKLNQVNNPYLTGENYFESTIDGYNHLNIFTSNKTHFLYYANDNDRCGEAQGSWMSLVTEWKINTFQLDESYQAKKSEGSIKKLPYDSLYMHVFFDSNQNGIIENPEYSCTLLKF